MKSDDNGKMDLNSFVDWVNEKPQTRSVSIEIKRQTLYPATNAATRAGSEVTVWVYDHVLETGQFVKSVDEIDLERRKEEKERLLLQQLKKKYEGGDAA
ncbi:MAG: hypothetical protein K6T66_06675 [Peptococcaceae bacterium]|nr:hypothetical protein [Peptococcaceae bacterium]